MRNIALRSAIFSVALAFAPSAYAAQSITISPAAVDGTVSGSFHNDGLVAGAFSDVFNFMLPAAGWAGATISSVFTTGESNNVNFSSVTLNGTEFAILSTGDVEFRALSALEVPSGLQTLAVSGTSGGSGSYAGALSFVPASAVPEPATWAMMLFGLGTIGFTFRRRHAARNVSFS